MKLILTIILTVMTFQATFGQVYMHSTDSIVSEIKNYIERIDADESLAEGIAEGVIEYDGQTGGFETYNLFDRDTKELHRIRHNEVTDTILNLTFYYKDNELVYGKSEKGYRKNNKYTDDYKQEIYFSHGQIIYETSNGMKTDELREIGLNHLKTHNEYYDIKRKN